jgi:MFS family permease
MYGAFAIMASTLGAIADLLRRLSVFFGWLGDKISRRQTPFLLGVTVLGSSTLCFALGSTLPVLFIARVLEGLIIP